MQTSPRFDFSEALVLCQRGNWREFGIVHAHCLPEIAMHACLTSKTPSDCASKPCCNSIVNERR